MIAHSPPQTLPQIRDRCRQALDVVRRELLEARTGSDHWTGELSPSALSTATAVSAIAAVLHFGGAQAGESTLARESDPENASWREIVGLGMRYLTAQQNADGGFGDTDRSHSNIATSYLVLAASALAERIHQAPLPAESIERLQRYLIGAGAIDGLRRRYGTDKTFVVPIMNNLAIAGLISWNEVAALPFEAAVFPQSMYRFLQMPVVSYAIPALVAIGQARHFLGRRAPFPLRLIRSLSVRRTMAVLEKMQPASGGYLEATPLTAFVVMSLAATGRCELPVVRNGMRFLKESMLPGGSWPIDTNLATWVTSLSIHALACDPADDGSWYSDALADWHLGCQHLQQHPFTGARPGGWGWTDLSGAVPDSDDTPAAMLAIGLMRRYADSAKRASMDRAIKSGAAWLLQLQNRNGGWPTFCRGWGKLPFDRSSNDLTAHAIRALRVVNGRRAGACDSTGKSPSVSKAFRDGAEFLHRNQGTDGSWSPLWFGNQDRPDEDNPVYGTAKVLVCGGLGDKAENAGIGYLIRVQNPDGGWGGGESVAAKIRQLVTTDERFSATGIVIPSELISSVEETALAVEALATVLLRSRAGQRPQSAQSRTGTLNTRSDGTGDGLTKEPQDYFAAGNEALQAAILRGVEFLMRSVQDRRHRVAWPIGFYFAKLWYHERLYPLIFTAAAFGKFLRVCEVDPDPRWPG